jgi:hypothetical protein
VEDRTMDEHRTSNPDGSFGRLTPVVCASVIGRGDRFRRVSSQRLWKVGTEGGQDRSVTISPVPSASGDADPWLEEL